MTVKNMEQAELDAKVMMKILYDKNGIDKINPTDPVAVSKFDNLAELAEEEAWGEVIEFANKDVPVIDPTTRLPQIDLATGRVVTRARTPLEVLDFVEATELRNSNYRRIENIFHTELDDNGGPGGVDYRRITSDYKSAIDRALDSYNIALRDAQRTFNIAARAAQMVGNTAAYTAAESARNAAIEVATQARDLILGIDTDTKLVKGSARITFENDLRASYPQIFRNWKDEINRNFTAYAETERMLTVTNPGILAEDLARFAAGKRSPVAAKMREFADKVPQFLPNGNRNPNYDPNFSRTREALERDLTQAYTPRKLYYEILTDGNLDYFNKAVGKSIPIPDLQHWSFAYQEYAKLMIGDDNWADVDRLIRAKDNNGKVIGIDNLARVKEVPVVDPITGKKEKVWRGFLNFDFKEDQGFCKPLLTYGGVIADHESQGPRHVAYGYDMPSGIIKSVGAPKGETNIMDAHANKAYKGFWSDIAATKKFFDAVFEYAESPEELDKLKKCAGFIRGRDNVTAEMNVMEKLVELFIDVNGSNKVLRFLALPGLDRVIAMAIPSLRNPLWKAGGSFTDMKNNVQLRNILLELVRDGIISPEKAWGVDINGNPIYDKVKLLGFIPWRKRRRGIAQRKWLTLKHGLPGILELFGMILFGHFALKPDEYKILEQLRG